MYGITDILERYFCIIFWFSCLATVLSARGRPKTSVCHTRHLGFLFGVIQCHSNKAVGG